MDRVPTLGTVSKIIPALKVDSQEPIVNSFGFDRDIVVICLLYSNSVLSSGTFQPTIKAVSQQNEKLCKR